MEAPGFWEDQAKSAPVLRQRRTLERRFETLKQIRRDAEELAAWRELLAEGEADDEAVTFTDRLEKDLEQLELALKLAGPDDGSNALVAIHPGAGGTESQDWAEMLLRMFLRYAEQHDFATEMLDQQDGEEAGIKSATFAVRGANAYGYLKSECGVHRLV
ncbi:MAG: PCRF domain-containing protein, partial [bacterium]|nr:PCRF domain-containing protein [bacterium]